MRRFEGKVSLVTGAAGGIGSAITDRLLAEGSAVFAVDCDEQGLAALADRHDGAETLRGHRAELGDTTAATAAVEAAVACFGRLDVLCNNHAATEPDIILSDRDLLSTPLETWERTFAVNLMGPVALCRAAIPHLRQRGGAIVNIVSTSGMTGDLVYTAYGASKAALISLTQYAATQYGRDGIRVNAVAPGMVLTPGAHNKLSGDQLDQLAASNLVPGLGAPEDIAAAVAFLASDDGRYVTGEVLRADGGQMSHMSTYATLRRD